LLERGFTVDQIERLLRAPTDPAAESIRAREADAKLASLLVQYEVPAPTMEQVLKLFQSAEPALRPSLCDSIEEMLDSEAKEEQLIAAVRLLCQQRDKPEIRAASIT
jgi:hypothetical protein